MPTRNNKNLDIQTTCRLCGRKTRPLDHSTTTATTPLPYDSPQTLSPPAKRKTPLDRSTPPPRREQPHGGGSVAALRSVYRGGKGNGSRAAAAYIYTAGRRAPRSVYRTPAAGSNIRPVVSRTTIKTYQQTPPAVVVCKNIYNSFYQFPKRVRSTSNRFFRSKCNNSDLQSRPQYNIVQSTNREFGLCDEQYIPIPYRGNICTGDVSI